MPACLVLLKSKEALEGVRMTSDPKHGRVRPRTAHDWNSVATNHQALAWEAKQLIDAAKAEGKKLKISGAMRQEVYASVRRNN